MDILTALIDLLAAVGLFLWAVLRTLAPWTPLIAWIAFWSLAVNWVQLRSLLLRGGWIGVVLLGLCAVIVWGVIAPPEAGVHSLLGLKVSNFVGKTVYVTTLIVIMLLCGSMQLSGCCDRLLCLDSPVTIDDSHADSHHDVAGAGHHDGNGSETAGRHAAAH